MSQSAPIPGWREGLLHQAGENGSADAFCGFCLQWKWKNQFYARLRKRALFQQILQPQGSKIVYKQRWDFCLLRRLWLQRQLWRCIWRHRQPFAAIESASFFWCRVYFYHKQEGQICVRQPRVAGLVADTPLPPSWVLPSKTKITLRWFLMSPFLPSLPSTQQLCISNLFTPTQLISTVVKTGSCYIMPMVFPTKIRFVAPCLGNLRPIWQQPSQTTS